MMKWFIVLVILLAVPLSALFPANPPAPPPPPEYTELTNYVHLVLGDEELWIPELPEDHWAWAQIPPERAHFGMGVKLVSRPDSQGDPIRFYPLVTPPPLLR